MRSFGALYITATSVEDHTFLWLLQMLDIRYKLEATLLYHDGLTVDYRSNFVLNDQWPVDQRLATDRW